jgi:hypothetical protein
MGFIKSITKFSGFREGHNHFIAIYYDFNIVYSMML